MYTTGYKLFASQVFIRIIVVMETSDDVIAVN